jgi:hypothetical protein
MEQRSQQENRVVEREIIAGIKLVETQVRVSVPVFEDYKVDKPVFVERQIEIPKGFDIVINALALDISDKVMASILKKLDEKLAQAIDARLTEIKVPKIIEELQVKYKDVEVDRPVFKDVDISRPTYVDKEIINPIIKDVEVTNCIPIDKPVVNAIVNEVHVTNAIIKDVEVERAVIREKVIDVIHKNCFDSKGNALV